MMKFRNSLTRWVIAVVIVLAILLCVTWFVNQSRFEVVSAFVGGYLAGMLAMYLAMRIRRSRIEAGLWF